MELWTSSPDRLDEWGREGVEDASAPGLSKLGEEMKAQLARLGPIVEELDLSRDQTPAIDRAL